MKFFLGWKGVSSSLHPPLNPYTSSPPRSRSPTVHHPPPPAFNPALHLPCSIASSTAACVQLLGWSLKNEGNRAQRAVWNPLASEGISVSLWEPYWLPSFIIIPPPFPSSGSGTDHPFGFSLPSCPFCPPFYFFLSYIYIYLFAVYIPLCGFSS